jgi:hypothetical protein
MVDEEVETTLREIRERVRKAAELESTFPRTAVGDEANLPLSPSAEPGTKTPHTLARIDAYLTTTARAWDRLPPIVSNRSGALARLELWVKRHFKKATRWYSWEQINFNAAVHHALRDTLDALLDLEKRLEQLRAEKNAEKEVSERQREQIQRDIATQRAQIESQRAAFESQRAEFKAYRGQIEAEQQARSLELNARLDDLVRELRERDQHRLEEQRVCFKQLSLEMSESEVLLDRARRDFESRLDKLESPKRKS